MTHLNLTPVMLSLLLVFSVDAISFHASPFADAADAFRPPAVPLIACDPYFSVWSQSDNLWESHTTHWTGKPHRLSAIVRVDGVAYRLMGATPQTIAAMKQQSVRVLPTRTIYEFIGAGVRVELTFTTPSLPQDLAVLSRPTTYVNCAVTSTNDRSHEVEFYFDVSAELASNTPDQVVIGSVESYDHAVALKLGTETQEVLAKSGDDLRIDWGYLYLAAADQFRPSVAFGDANTLRDVFGKQGAESIRSSQSIFPDQSGRVVAAVAMSMGQVSNKSTSRYILVAYDDLYSIEYMKQWLRPYWRRNGWEAKDLIVAAIDEHDVLEDRCASFDAQLMKDLEQAGGKQYAEIAALAFRQCFAAGKFVADANGQPLQFSKENHSNGCIATSDVFYPMAPQFLLFGPTLTKSMLVPFMDYAASERWKFPFAPHDLGTYPKANGQRYGGGERSEENQMPVEECGNLLLLFGALATMEGNTAFAEIYWPQLKQWAEYLKDKGFDPDNQLCTDDFAGHMAHNVNLSAKAICGLGAFALLCEMKGDHDEAGRYQSVAKQYAGQWVDAARDGDHFRLAFDQQGSWSQKYNLVWDRLLNLGLFPEEVFTTEMSFYRKTQNRFGLPLDNRSDYTKLDWILWTATLTNQRDDFDALVQPVHRFLHETSDRSPMTDWYFTSTAKKRGFTARPVVGGVFLKMLYDTSLWQSYATKDVTRASRWAPLPRPRKTTTLLATNAQSPSDYRISTQQPGVDWYRSEFDDSHWRLANGGLGTRQTPDAPVKTVWNSDDVWIRRTFELSATPPKQIALRIWHDEDAVVYINGIQVRTLTGFTTEYETIEIPADSLQQGKNLIAVHCHQSSGGQFIDFGLETYAGSD